jgi:hypothetical protein
MSSQTDRIFAEFEGGGSLPRMMERLLAAQKKAWSDLQKNYLSLEKRLVRELSSGASILRVEFNPGRINSTSSNTDALAVSSRACFLCRENLPPAQKGILYRGKYLVLCNPYPIFDNHFTVANLEHTPQNIQGSIEAFLSLLTDLGPQFTIFYNGPECGASAPDHLHFQTCPSGVIPVESVRCLPADRASSFAGCGIYAVEDAGRAMVLVESPDTAAIKAALLKIIDSLKKRAAGKTEPLLNMIAWKAGGAYRAVLFPRRKFRPDCYYAAGEERVLVSPAAVEMGGLIITPLERDFGSMDFARASAILREVSAGRDFIMEILAGLKLT